ncbi:NAD-dependent epimerase/dehydratase [Spirillospora sp. NPDC047279]|uniref:NAD-dependent epimerase/dehydratase family protein n=1 Tax=Spirillospora sp. NPDC047279 TaxID=3155478 RepID=UPI0033EE361B
MTAAKRVAVLGASGSVGRHVCPALARRGHEVLAIARHPAPQIADYPFLAFDLGEGAPEKLGRIIDAERIDAVVNVAGRSGDSEAELARSYHRLVERLVTALEPVPSRPRFVHLGSVHEYGPVPAGTLIGESLPERPANAYARAKLAGSRAVLAATRRGALNGVVLRTVNTLGPYPPRETFPAALLGLLRTAAVTREPVELDVAAAERDFVDVRDLAEALVSAVTAPVEGEVVNIGRGEAVGIADLVAICFAAAGLPLDLMRLKEAPVRSQGGDWTCADIRAARRLLGWRPVIGLRDSARAMWEATDD